MPFILIAVVLGVIGFGSIAAGAAARSAEEKKRNISREQAIEMLAIAHSSSDIENMHEIANALSLQHPDFANQIRGAISTYTRAVNASIAEARSGYWKLVGMTFLGLANRLQAEREVLSAVAGLRWLRS